MNPVAAQFGNNLRYCRRRAGLSQEEVGFRASLHRTEIGLLERGERIPRIDTAMKLAGALAIPPGELLTDIEWTPGSVIRGGFELTPAPEDSP
jgi:XRE family transcriptional regulator, regulator of sulfur utilization